MVIYPSTALKNKQREIKAIADREMVHITENGYGKYIFASEEVLRRAIDEAVEDALYEARMAEALRSSRADFAAGRVYQSRDDLMAAVSRKRAARAWGGASSSVRFDMLTASSSHSPFAGVSDKMGSLMR